MFLRSPHHISLTTKVLHSCGTFVTINEPILIPPHMYLSCLLRHLQAVTASQTLLASDGLDGLRTAGQVFRKKPLYRDSRDVFLLIRLRLRV